MARIRADYVFGTIDAAIDSDDTTLSSVALARLPAVTGSDIAAVTLHDPDAGTYEIVHVTAHAASATTSTILRGQEGSTAQSWASGTAWVHGITQEDVSEFIAGVGGVAQGDRLRHGTRALPSNTWVKRQSFEEDSDGMVIDAFKVEGDSTDVNVDGGIIVKHGKDYVSTPGYSDTLQVYTLAGSAGTIIGNNAYVGDGATPYDPPTDGSAQPDGFVRFELGPIWPYSEKGRFNNRGDFIVGWTLRTSGSTYTQSGTTVTRSSGSASFTADDIGAYLMWTGAGSRGQVDRIVGYVSATQVTVETSRTVGSAIAAQVRVANVVVCHDGTVETAAGLEVQGRPGQAGSLLRVRDSSGATLFAVAADGTLTGDFPTSGSAGRSEVLMQDGVTGPPVPIETEAGDDWLHEG